MHASAHARRNPLQWPALIGFILLCFATAIPAAWWPPGAWYIALAKPAWHPPTWLFGPVWSTLYLLIGTSGWRVWRHGGFAMQRRPLALFVFQLILNAAWSPLFFGLKQPGIAFAEILALWLAILATILVFRRIDRPAAWLLAPYLAWVSFAAVLNGTLWQLNG